MKTLIKLIVFIFIASIASCSKKSDPTPAPAACFQASSVVITHGYPIVTSNCSANATSYLWDFGNGMTSSESAPVVIYNTAGTYTLKLVAINSSGTNSSESVILVK